MPGIDQIPAEFQPLAGLLFAIIIAVGGAWTFLQGRRQGPPQPKVQEFYAAGGLADMGPVKELVEGVGLLYQQQVRTNIAIERLANLYEKHLEDQATQEAIEEKAQALFERRLAMERDGEETPRPRKPRGAP